MNEPTDHEDRVPASPATAPPPVVTPGDESTVGIGTGIALGCIALTVVVILLGVIFVLALRWLG